MDLLRNPILLSLLRIYSIRAIDISSLSALSAGHRNHRVLSNEELAQSFGSNMSFVADLFHLRRREGSVVIIGGTTSVLYKSQRPTIIPRARTEQVNNAKRSGGSREHAGQRWTALGQEDTS